jgi:alpha-N-arabinofuranosidase
MRPPLRPAPLLAALAYAAAGGAQPRIVVDADAPRGAVPRDVFGGDLEFINTRSPEVEAVAAELPLLRFPGGDADSVFRWDQPLAPRCTRPGFDWPAAAAVAARGGAAVFLETNIVQSTPDNAALWVQDATRRGLRVAGVGIGNEVWGDWDAGHRTAARYAADVVAHAAAIRARVPGTRIVLEIGTRNEDAWNREALRRTAAVIDAVDYHYYPNHHAWRDMDPVEVAAGADGVAPLLARLRAMIRDEAGARAGAIGVMFGEWDGAADAPLARDIATLVTPRAYAMWSMADALFYGAALGEMINGGVAAAMFYEVQGFRFGAVPGDWCVDADTTVRRPKYLVHRLWREHFGETLLGVTASGMPTFRVDGPTNWDGFAGDAPYVRAYASLTGDGRALRLIVAHRGGAGTVPALAVDLRGFAPAARASVWEVGGGGLLDTNENVRGPVDAVRVRAREVDVAGAAFTLALAPYSVTAVELRRREAPAMDAGAATTDAPAPRVDAPADVARDAAGEVGRDARAGDVGGAAVDAGGCGVRARAAPRAWWIALAALAAATLRRPRARGNASGAFPRP